MAQQVARFRVVTLASQQVTRRIYSFPLSPNIAATH
jgi:hypothetical protein